MSQSVGVNMAAVKTVIAGALSGLPRIDTAVSAPIAHKYAMLTRVVANLQPADVGRIFACSQDDPHVFLPAWGLHANEFFVAYCRNLPHKRTDGTPTILSRQMMDRVAPGPLPPPPRKRAATVASKPDALPRVTRKRAPASLPSSPPSSPSPPPSPDGAQPDLQHNSSPTRFEAPTVGKRRRRVSSPARTENESPSSKPASPKRKRARR